MKLPTNQDAAEAPRLQLDVLSGPPVKKSPCRIMKGNLMQTNPRRLLVLCSVLLALLPGIGGSAAENRFVLQVNDVSGLDEPWPLVGGLPFPEGALRDASLIRITRDGREVPAQVDVTATWRDGSIRWALAGFMGSPQGSYEVEFGPGVSRRRPATPLRVEHGWSGQVRIDTGAATYEFASGQLLPNRVALGGVAVFDGAGEGAYLVDNQGRRSRVSGPRADVTSEVVKEGSGRFVLRREGWYVTDSGERVARARAWFYFMAGSPAVRITHSLILTEDTNRLWVRDYGLELATPVRAEEVAFALNEPSELERASTRHPAHGREATPEEILAMSEIYSRIPPGGAQRFTVKPGGDEVFLLQDQYAHFLERDFRAVIGRASSASSGSGVYGAGPELLKEFEQAGDWADARYADHGLTVVVPWLAQQFPKEIAFGPGGVRVALWSNRSGRELDFRAATLAKDYWQTWAQYYRSRQRSGEAAAKLAGEPSNAQCAARTQDVWLLPRALRDSENLIHARAAAAARPPLLQADPAWLCASEAIGWPMHSRDERQFPEEEAMLEKVWHSLMARYAQLRMTGFIAWGAPPHIRGYSDMFRVSALVDYGLRRHIWGLYARSGDRRYYEFASRLNRFGGDWNLAHWTAGEKFKGGFVGEKQLHDFWSRPIYWGSMTQVNPIGGNTGHDIANWLREYHLTGDEYALELTRLHGEALKEHWPQAKRSQDRYDGIHMVLRVMSDLYAREWDEDFRRMAQEVAQFAIDLNSPNGINDAIRFGALYKVDRNAISLYFYHRETGDPRARESLLKAMDYEHRFDRISSDVFSGQNYSMFLYSIAYRWTRNPAYLGLLNRLLEAHRRGPDRPVNITMQINPTMGMPAALAVMAEPNLPVVPPVPLLSAEGGPIVFRKPEGRAVKLSAFVKTLNEEVRPKAAATLRQRGSLPLRNLEVRAEQMMATAYEGRRDLTKWHLSVAVPAEAPAGEYALEVAGAAGITLLESSTGLAGH